MKLLTADIIKRMPGPRAQENVADPIAYVKFFSCGNGWTWYAYETWQIVVNAATGEFIEERPLSAKSNPGEKVEDIIFMGLVHGFESEQGTFSLNEFEAINKRMILGVERDRGWTPRPLSQCTR